MHEDYLAYRQEPEKRPVSFKDHVIDFFQTLVVFAAIGTAVYWLVAQPHKVSGSSMFPNFKNGDYIITDKLSYKVSEPNRGDIVVFKNPRDETQDFIKRILAKPGDRIKVQSGKIFLNGEQINEPYLAKSVITSPGSFLKEGQEITVVPGHYITIGDNRSASSDSREWGFITREEIIGKVFFRYWPATEIGIYPAAYSLEK
ncbi:MAG TPA: signal peptidase I [Patescibacteria group bacterium]|nr:signal peptidase I [Patescibacteria group bacterium]